MKIETCQPIEWEINLRSPEELFTDNAWAAQEKLNGKRCVVMCVNGDLSAQTRNGNPIKLPAKARALLPLGNYIVDGELVGQDFTAFDVLEIGGEDVRGMSLNDRLRILSEMSVPQVQTFYGEEAKRTLYARVKGLGGEGVVFKRQSAKYKGGRTEHQMKLKNWKSDTFRVTSVDGRGVELEFDGRPAGRCAGYANPGDLVEVRFQDWTAAGKLMHPVLTEIRDDLL